jgi:hypothetical protein
MDSAKDTSTNDALFKLDTGDSPMAESIIFTASIFEVGAIRAMMLVP